MDATYVTIGVAGFLLSWGLALLCEALSGERRSHRE
jgi:hypothetical protein